jgi:hypothetical protein
MTPKVFGLLAWVLGDLVLLWIEWWLRPALGDRFQVIGAVITPRFDRYIRQKI